MDSVDDSARCTRGERREWLDRAQRFVLADRRMQLLIAVGFFVLAAVLAFTRRYLDTEGIFTHDIAATVAHGYLKPLLAIQAKPPLQLLYAPFSAIGYDAFLMAHAAFAAAGVWLIAQAARRWELVYPNVAAWVLATSLGTVISASNGYANADGAFVSALFLYLYASRRFVPAAIVLGLLPFVRHETALLAIGFFAWDVWQRRDLRFVALAFSLPALYLVAGAIYHQSILWPLTYFPNPPNIPAAIRGFEPPTLFGIGEFLLQSLVVNFGMLGLLAPFAVRAADKRVTLVFWISAIAIIGMAVNQYTGASGIDRSLRFHVALLPPIALLAAYVLASAKETAWIGAAALLVILLAVPSTRSVWLALPLAVVVGRLLARGRDGVAVARLLLVGASVLVFVAGIASDYGQGEHLRTHRVLAALEESGIYRGQALFTDRHITRYDRCADIDEAYFLVNEAIRWYISQHMALESEEFDEMVAAFRQQGMLVDADRHEVHTDGVYLFENGERMNRWRARIESEGPTAVELVEGFSAFHWPDR